MARIHFVTQGGERIDLEGQSGSLMSLATESFVEGIEGNCGGVCSCATCHVHLSAEDYEKVGPPSEIEQDMLDLTDGVNDYSRLCCQIELDDSIDGITLHVVNT